MHMSAKEFLLHDPAQVEGESHSYHFTVDDCNYFVAEKCLLRLVHSEFRSRSLMADLMAATDQTMLLRIRCQKTGTCILSSYGIQNRPCFPK